MNPAASVLLVISSVCLLGPGADLGAADGPPRTLPKSCSLPLEQAAQALAAGDLTGARAGFDVVLGDTNAPAFVRALAYAGAGEAALAAKDAAAAEALWRRQAADIHLAAFYRDAAHRQLVEADRARRGLAVRDPAEFRESLPALPAAAATFHVAPRGSDTNDGSEARPFATLTQARDAVRAYRKSHGGRLPAGGVRVLLEAGDYAVNQTLQLTAEDSGTSNAPVVFQARPGASVRLRGGIRVANWRPVNDPSTRARLSPAIVDAVREAELKDLGPSEWGDATALRRRPELFVDGVPQTLARWPDAGFVKTGDILGTNTFKVWNSIPGCKDGRFRFVEDRPRAWIDEPDVRLYGYWFWDWYEEYQTVAAIDPEARSFALAEPYSNYGYRKDQRYFAVNVLRELDQPGEWYLDRRTGRVYWLPPSGLPIEGTEVILSRLEAPFLELRHAEHVVVQGLTLEEGRADGIHIAGGAECLVAGCVLRRLGGDGVVVEGGRHHGIFGCRLETLGCGGTRVAGGDRGTLEPGGHFVENCTVSDISRLKRTYTPAVLLEGCGNRIAHNRFENMPSSALRIEGNNHLIELNVIRDVVKESDDQGGADLFGNPLYRGVVFRWNRWSDIGGGTHNGAAGIRLDDMISGVVIHGNIFERCGAVIFGGVQIHGGKDNLVDGNLFLECFAGVSFSRWGDKRWREGIASFLPQAKAEPYATRYPDLAALEIGADVNDLARNAFVRCPRIYLRDGGVPRSALLAVIEDATDIDTAARGETPALRRILLPSIPLPEIGPYPHPWQAATAAPR